jgi:integrase
METTTDKPEKKPRSSRRGKGEGSIVQRADGTWMAQIEIGRDANGKRQRKTFYGKTKKAVADKLTGEANALLTGTSAVCGKMTVADLLQKWLTESAIPNTSRATSNQYERIAKLHVTPKVGHIKLSAVRPLHIQTMLSTLETAGVGARTRQYCYVLLHRAFVVAMRWQLVIRNPCDGVDPPKVKKRPVTPLTVEQAKTLLKASELDRLHAVYVLALTTGMRQGELFGLQWEDVDLKAGILQVRHSLEDVKGILRLKEPKSEAGKRQIALPKVAVNALNKRRKTAMAEGLAGCPMVFPAPEGGFLRKCSFSKWSWSKIRTAAKIGEGVHFHDLRHSSASLMLADGVDVKSIQTILGHSNISMTMDIYAHLMPDAQRKAAATFYRLLG